mmetsp:Transcript_20121/g.28061  ORF Transcript_20121/g.28061 Transcript_20121/m.28061 type:complete len:853 (+) Transcript_20121:174-2732(+)|eukprot:CAMPEP_0184486450 /NCGR_PEP_ID=MMETSP0113_2-20130426/7945_1 /TAXON_ID=91329 /ORGANISM="Norrisiella sphaerica, Strain BC52" /LENGTH=852 /DNA_ID=CAMNT_0026868341 /DNA_START=188 /DNA_END=2749 /DNA_ORIENTATION=-
MGSGRHWSGSRGSGGSSRRNRSSSYVCSPRLLLSLWLASSLLTFRGHVHAPGGREAESSTSTKGPNASNRDSLTRLLGTSLLSSSRHTNTINALSCATATRTTATATATGYECGRTGSMCASASKDGESLHKPERIMGNSKLSLKKRIRIAKNMKQISEENEGVDGGGGATPSYVKPVQKTAFTRKKKLDNEEDEEPTPALRVPEGESGNLRQMYTAVGERSMLLIDAYNVMHLWPDLKSLMSRGEGAEARSLFIERIGEFITWRGIKAKIIFDGMAELGHDTPGWANLEIVFSHTKEADNVISEEILNLHHEDVHPVFVATNDNAVQTSTLSYGGIPVTSIMLVQEVELAYEELQQIMHEYNVYDAYISKLPGDRARWVEDMTIGFQRKMKLASSSVEERAKLMKEEEQKQAARLSNKDLQGRLGGALNRDTRQKLEKLKRQLKTQQRSQPKIKAMSNGKSFEGKKSKSEVKKDIRRNIGDAESLGDSTVREAETQNSPRMMERESICLSGCCIHMLNGVYTETDIPILGRPHFVKKLPAVNSGALHLYYVQTDGVGRWVISETVGGGFRALVNSDVTSPTLIQKYQHEEKANAEKSLETKSIDEGAEWHVFNYTWVPTRINVISTAQRASPNASSRTKNERKKSAVGNSNSYIKRPADNSNAEPKSVTAFGQAFAGILGRPEHKMEPGVQVTVNVSPELQRKRHTKTKVPRPKSNGNLKGRPENGASMSKKKKSQEPSLRLSNGDLVIMSEATTFLNEYCLKNWSKPPNYEYHLKASAPLSPHETPKTMHVAAVSLPGPDSHTTEGKPCWTKRQARASAALAALKTISQSSPSKSFKSRVSAQSPHEDEN